MKTLLKKIFIHNWPRKALSVILALIIWFVVNQTMTSTKTISGISVRVMNIPQGKTVEGIHSDDLLNRKITLTLTGNKKLLEDLNSNDFEVVIDAMNREGEWIATITKKNLAPLNPEINLSQGISKVSAKNFIVKMTKFITEKIPIIITQPIGEAPKGYKYVDIWPYHLYITISGPEEVVKKLKTRGLKLIFNLNDISKAELDDLRADSTIGGKDAVSFYVPNHWKQISLPALSSTPLEINDPNAKHLRIDFIRDELLPIQNPIPISLFFPPNYSNVLNPQKAHIALNNMVNLRHGIKMITEPLYVKGVSELFLELMRDMLQIVVIASPTSDKTSLEWSVQFINHQLLEERYVSTLMSDITDDESNDLEPKAREAYLRNRFRNYMNRFRLFKEDNKKLKLDIELKGNSIVISEVTVNGA